MIATENILPAIVLTAFIIIGCAWAIFDAHRRARVEARSAACNATTQEQIALSNAAETARRKSMAMHPAGKGRAHA